MLEKAIPQYQKKKRVWLPNMDIYITSLILIHYNILHRCIMNDKSASELEFFGFSSTHEICFCNLLHPLRRRDPSGIVNNC